MIPVAVAPDIVLVQDARPVASETRSLPRPGVPPVIFTCPATSSFAPGEGVPIPTFPAERIRTFSVLFVLNTRSIASVVPRKLVPATVPALPSMTQAPPTAAGVTQVASHVASDDESTFPVPGVPQVIFICPATSSRAVGDAVPIPIFPAGTPTVPLSHTPNIALPILS